MRGAKIKAKKKKKKKKEKKKKIKNMAPNGSLGLPKKKHGMKTSKSI